MGAKDYGFAGLLLGLAALIWGRDLSWTATAENTAPIAAALPVFWWLGRPWRFRPQGEGGSSVRTLGAGVLLFLAGVGLDLTFLLSLGWVLLLAGWLSARLEAERWRAVRRLLILPLLAFPWIALEGDRIGWWFRLSGAWATQSFFSLAGFAVEREGTFLLVQGLPMRVDAACAGLNELQSMLIAGTGVAYLYLGGHSRYWWSFPLLVSLAWLANALRIMALGAAALTVSPEFAMGAFHHWGGWLVLCLMFALCWLMFARLQRERGALAPDGAD